MSEQIKNALNTLKQAMLDEPDYAWSWHCNIAMPIYDSINEYGTQNKIAVCEANITASDLMKHLFGIDMEQNPIYKEWKEKQISTADQDDNYVKTPLRGATRCTYAIDEAPFITPLSKE